MVTMDYIMDIPEMGIEHGDFVFENLNNSFGQFYLTYMSASESFRLSYYPHRLDEFKGLLKEAFGESCNHTVFGDFKQLDEITDPAFFIHLVEKKTE